MVDEVEREIRSCEAELRRLGADHAYVPHLMTVPGIGWVLGYTIAAEIGDIDRFASPKKLAGYTGLCPRVHQSGQRDRRGSLANHGPKHLRWALIEAATTAARHPLYKERYQRTKRRLGRQRGPSIARSSWLATSRPPSGTCSPTTNPSPRQAPHVLWSRDDPTMKWAAGTRLPPDLVLTAHPG